LLAVLPVLKKEGYRVISLSGGEPLLYGSLEPLIEGARLQGFRVTMITNGLLVTKRIEPLLEHLNAVAISFDGLAPTHNKVRGRPDAFERASLALARLAEKGLAVGAAVSLGREAIPELPDLVDHLVGLGVRAIQVRPMARAGRAKAIPNSCYSQEDQARLYLVVMALQEELGTKVRLHCDLVPTKDIWERRNNYGGLLATCSKSSERSLSDLINPLVLTDDGLLKPIAYDFAKQFDIGSVAVMSNERLEEYKLTGAAPFQSLIGAALGNMKAGKGFVDWFDYCTRLSECKTVKN
jgi:hypothetical protein